MLVSSCPQCRVTKVTYRHIEGNCSNMIFFCLRWQNHTNSDSRCCAGVPCGVTNPNMDVKGRNPDALQLGAEIGSVVMGQEEWEKYITTSVKAMKKEHRPTPQLVSQKLAAERPSGEREGWVFHHVARDASWDASMWAMIDQIDVGHDRPDHFYLARPHRRKSVRVLQSVREAISEAYHRNWYRYSAAKNKDQKDTDAGMKLSRSRPTYRNTYICIQIQILGIHISMARHQTCPVNLHTYTLPNSHARTRTHNQTLTPVFVHT